MPLRWNSKTRLSVLIVGLLVVIAFFVMAWRWPEAVDTNTAATSNRQHYAALYQAAWRQDDGQDTTLMTATVFVPPTVQALAQDTGRSSAEQQIVDATQHLTAQQVPVVITIDSVTGTTTDEAIKKGLTLSAEGGPRFTLADWKPMIAPSRIVNTSGSTSSQIGVAVFEASQVVNWDTLQSLRLDVKDIGGEPLRTFSWTEPGLLLQVE